MARPKGGDKDRLRISSGPFRMRIALSTSEIAPTRTEVSVYGRGRPDILKFHGGPKRGKLEQAVHGYAVALGRIVGRPWSPEAPSPAPAEELLKLQRAAIGLFGAIFRHISPKREPKVREDLDFYLGHENLQEISFDSDLAGVPFDALHYGRPDSLYDPMRFIGFRVPVLHAPRTDKDPRVEPEGPLTVGLLGYAKVTSVGVRDEESILALFQGLGCPCGAREHTPLCDLHGNRMDVADLASLFRTLGQLRSVWHITSHMQDVAGQQYFILDNGLEVRPQFFSEREPDAGRFVGEPLVFMNICMSTATGIIEDAGYPDALHDMEAGGVIAAHCLVNVRFATEFARRFYRLAFSKSGSAPDDRATVGESLHRARVKSLREDSSIASLCCSSHALADFPLPEAGDEDTGTDRDRGDVLHGAS